MKRTFFAIAAAASMLVSGAAQATELFATYGQMGNTGKTLELVNNASGVGGTLSSIGMPMVDFWYNDQSPLPPSLQNHLNAYFSLNAVSSSAATSTGSGANTRYYQNFETGSLSFTLPASAGVGSGSGTNLLSITFNNMELNGRGTSGGTNASYDLVLGYGSVLTLTSDFYDFSALTAADLSLTLSAIAPAVALAMNGSIASFQASSSGTFSTDPAPTYVPEPAMLGLFGMGAIGLGFARRRKN